jgi:hypothetical protein
MKNTDLPQGDLLVNKVYINLYMLGGLMLNRIPGHLDSPDVVTINNSSLLDGMMKFC